MTQKVAVFKSVASGYGFFFKNFKEVIRVSWLPGLLMALPVYYLFSGMMDVQLPVEVETDAGPDMAPIPNFWVYGLAMNVGAIALIMGLYRIYFDLPRGTSFVYFRFGAAEFRLIGFFIIWYLGFLLFFVVIFFVSKSFEIFIQIIPGLSETIVLDDENGTQIDTSQIGAMAQIAFVVVMVVSFIVFGFLYTMRFIVAPAVISAEKTIGYRRTWELTRGNAWRLFFGLILASLPLLIFEVLIVVFAFGDVLAQQSSNDLQMEDIESVLERFKSPVVIGLAIFGLLYTYCCHVGFTGQAYRSLAQPKKGRIRSRRRRR